MYSSHLDRVASKIHDQRTRQKAAEIVTEMIIGFEL